MSDFSSMTVVFESPKVETETVYEPVQVGALKRAWLKITRKPLPTVEHTYDVPHFHTVELDDSHDADRFESLTERFGAQGYSVVSVNVETVYGSDELTGGFRGEPDMGSLSVFFRSMIEDQWRTGAYIAFVMEYGWDASGLTAEWMDDRYHGAWESAADYVQDLVQDCYSPELPDFVSVDWDDTADNLGQDYDYVRHNSETHVFSRY